MSAGKVQGLGDVDLAALILDGKKLDARIDGSTVAAGLERTIDAASTVTITVEDPERFLQAGRYYQRRADLLLDDLWFRMVAVSKAGDQFALTFEDREVAMLRQQTKPRKMSRAKATRAEFLQALVQELPHIGFVCPELHKKQPVGKYSKQDQKTLDINRVRGIADGATLACGTTDQASKSQISQMNRALNVAESDGAGPLASLALVCAGIGESEFRAIRNQGHPPSDFWGVFQGGIHTFKIDDTEGMAHAFLVGGQGFQAGGAIKLARDNPGIDPGEIATRVEASGKPASFYGKWAGQARKIIDAYGSVDSSPSSDGGSGRAYVTQYEFARGQPTGPRGEDTWACGQRLAQDVDWRWFIVAGVVYFISDYDLIRSRPRMTLNETSPGVDQIDYTVDVSRKVPDQVTITCRAGKWAAPPGTVIVLDETMGDVAGAWIVTDIARPDLTSQTTTITAGKPATPRHEPASQVTTHPASSQPGLGQTLDGGVNAGPTRGAGNYPAGGWVGTYLNPFRGAKVVATRIDEGVDYSVIGPIRAIGKAKIISITAVTSGWRPWYLIYRLLEGPLAGNYVFIAEYFTPAHGLQGDQTVEKGAVIGHSMGGGIEMGWGSPTPQVAYAVWRGGGYTEGHQTAAGTDFDQFMQSLGVPAGHHDDRYPKTIQGHYP